MNQAIAFLFILLLTLQVHGQKTKSLEGISPPEIRNLILTQSESEEAREMIIKHNRSRRTSYAFLGAALLLGVISGNSSNPDNDNKSSIEAAGWSITSGLIAIACGISAGERMRNAKKIYLNNDQVSSFNESYIRFEVGIQRVPQN